MDGAAGTQLLANSAFKLLCTQASFGNIYNNNNNNGIFSLKLHLEVVAPYPGTESVTLWAEVHVTPVVDGGFQQPLHRNHWERETQTNSG